MQTHDKIIVIKDVGELKVGMQGVCVIPNAEGIFNDRVFGISSDCVEVVGSNKNKYQRTVPSTTIDIYDVLTAWEVSNPAIQHAIKKLLQPGQRGHKTREQDLREALVSIERAIELEAK